MVYYILKIAITVLMIVVISEISKRSSFLGGLLASLPLVSYLAMIWLYAETKDIQKVANLAHSIFWLVLPSLLLFVLLPLLLKLKWNFYASLLISTMGMIGAYLGTIWILKRFSVNL